MPELSVKVYAILVYQIVRTLPVVVLVAGVLLLFQASTANTMSMIMTTAATISGTNGKCFLSGPVCDWGGGLAGVSEFGLGGTGSGMAGIAGGVGSAGIDPGISGEGLELVFGSDEVGGVEKVGCAGSGDIEAGADEGSAAGISDDDGLTSNDGLVVGSGTDGSVANDISSDVGGVGGVVDGGVEVNESGEVGVGVSIGEIGGVGSIKLLLRLLMTVLRSPATSFILT